ncbi:MAG: hypothetical protein E3K36_00900 [Candidatus Brocadia sp.]|nr:hypothetical protein [Candidatus Brocadia sp.]
MNIGRDINFLRLRKIFPRIFTEVFGFWISIGIAFFILLILLFVLIFPLSNQHVRVYKDNEDLSMALEKYAIKKDLYNDAWIESAKQESEIYNIEIERCRSFLKKRDDRLEAIFSREGHEKGLIKIEDEALWKNEYIKRVSLLLTKLETNNIAVCEGALPFQNWGPDIPTWDTILPAQKRFWILDAIINVALNDTGVTKLEKITFRESSPTYDPSFGRFYTIIPITLKVELQADRIQFFLHDILKSDISFVIEGITILSTDKVSNPDALMGNEDALSKKGTNNHISNPIVDVTIDAYVIDYKA